MKKIIFFADNLNQRGGIERVTSFLANALARNGYDIFILNVRSGDKPFFKIDSSIRIKSLYPKLDRIVLKTPFIVYRLRRLVIEEKPAFLITVGSMLALFSVPATWGLPLKNICWEHLNFNVDLGRRGRRIARQVAARLCDRIITLTQHDKILWTEGTNLKAQLQVIPNPCPFPVQTDHTPPQSSRLMLSVGRLTHQKGFDLLLRTWRIVIAEEPDWRLRIVGNGPDEQYLKQLSSQLGISGTVEFVSATADIQSHYREAALFCMSSRFEGFAIVLLEAMAFGIPVISFDCESGPAEILSGTGAALVPPGDVERLADNMLKLIRDPILRDSVGKAEKVRAEEFQVDNIIGKWISLLD